MWLAALAIAMSWQSSQAPSQLQATECELVPSYASMLNHFFHVALFPTRVGGTV